jgi:excisionase family DNA binding protein
MRREEKGCLLMKTKLPAAGRDGRFAYSVNEVCAVANVGRDALYGAIKRGELVARKLGKRTVVTAPDLERFLQGLPLCTPQGRKAA